MVYAEFGGQTECIMGNWKIENGFRINYYAENFRCNLTLTKVRSFLFSSLYDSFESEKFRFPFSTKNSPTGRVKCEKNKLQKIV